MIWEIVFHRDFEIWFFEQSEELQNSIAMVLNVLEEQGTNLGRPYVDTVKMSELPNLKELRVQHGREPYRVLFVFDPKRQAVLLVAGSKRGDKRWYEKNISIAQKRYENYLEETQGGEIL